MSDDPRMDRLEAQVDRADAKAERIDAKADAAGEPADAPHQEMAQAVADATVAAGHEAQRKMLVQMRGLIRDVKWFIVIVLVVVIGGILLFKN